MPACRLDHVASGCARQIRVVQDDAPHARRQLLVECVREGAQRSSPLVAVESKVTTVDVLLSDAAFSSPRDAHDHDHLGVLPRLPSRSRGMRGARSAERVCDGSSVAGANAQRRGTRSRARSLRAARSRDRNDHRRETRAPCQGDLGRRRIVRLRDVNQHRVTREADRAARSAERRMCDQGDSHFGAPVDDSSSQRGVVVSAEGDLYRRDVNELDRLVQLAAVDVCEPDRRTTTWSDESGQWRHGYRQRVRGSGA